MLTGIVHRPFVAMPFGALGAGCAERRLYFVVGTGFSPRPTRAASSSTISRRPGPPSKTQMGSSGDGEGHLRIAEVASFRAPAPAPSSDCLPRLKNSATSSSG